MIRRILARAAARLNDFTNALTLARTVRLMARQLDHMHLLAASEECRADRAEERVAELELQLADWREASGELVAEEEAADLRDAGEEARSPLPSCTCHEADIQRGRAEQAERERDANARAAGAHIKTIAELRAQLAEALRAVHRPASAEQIPGVAAARTLRDLVRRIRRRRSRPRHRRHRRSPRHEAERTPGQGDRPMTAKIETTERTPRLTHLPRCTKLTDPERYACNCGADGLAAKLDAAGALATVPAEERARIKQAGDAAAAAAWTASLGSISAMNAAAQAAIAREVAAWHAAHPSTLTPSEEAAVLAFRAGGAARVTEDELAEIEQLDREATPGPWTTDGGQVVETEHRIDPEADEGERTDVCECLNYGRDSGPFRTGTARFIAAARSLLPRLADEVRALRGERDEAHAALDPVVSRRDAMTDPPLSLTVRCATAARIAAELAARPHADSAALDIELARAVRDTLGETTHDGVIERLEELLDVEKESDAARHAPAADASLEAAERIWRGEWQRIAADIRSMSEAGKTPADILAILLTHLDMMKPLAVVRAVDASRPGLTEEQADAIALGCLQVRADLQRHAIKRAILRVDRGETGPTWGQLAREEYRRATEPERPAGLTRAMHDASTRPSVPPGAAFGEWPEPEAADPPEPDKARADAAEKRLADLRAWAADIVERSREEAPKHPGKANTTWTILSVLEWVVARIDGKEG